MELARGVAKREDSILEWLDNCDAVENYTVQHDSDVVSFAFDRAKQPTDGIPEGVFFDLTTAPF